MSAVLAPEPQRLGEAIERLALELTEAEVERLGAALSGFPGLPHGREAQRLEALIPNPGYERWFDRLLRGWEAEPETPGIAVALSLRTATAAHARYARQAVDVVWTGPSTAHAAGRRTDQVLLQLIGETVRELWLVSFAFHMVPTVLAALQAARARGVRLRLVLESAAEGPGKLDAEQVDAIKKALPEPVSLLKWPLEKRRKGLTGEPGLLHAKFAIGDSARLLVTSANLTENALTRNVEMGLLVNGPAAARVAAHLRALQEKGVLVAF